jgi:mono/diheme cytochrome c family protein
MVGTLRTPFSLCARLLGSALFLSASAAALAQEGPDPQVLSEGKDDYQWQCASCHGPDAKGDGPMAKMLVKPPADLTAIAKTNGGTFPFWRVYHIIAGKTAVPGHESFQMPDFWKRFKGQEWEFGFLPPHVRVLELTHYLESLQKK